MQVKGHITHDTYQRLAHLQNTIRDEYCKNLFIQRELSAPFHSKRAEERAFLQYIVMGDVAAADELIASVSANGFVIEAGEMSKSDVRQAVYMVVSTVTIFTRAAIDHGLPEDIAYNISDSYLHALDKLTEPNEINMLVFFALRSFCEAMQTWQYHACSSSIRICCEYIMSHLHEHISMADLSQVCHLSPNYISDLFEKELHMRPTAYIRSVKLKYAAYLLAGSPMEIAHIAYCLAFPSPSSFGAQFKAKYHITPLQYRNQTTRSGQKNL